MAAEPDGLKRISGISCAHRPRNTHGIAVGPRGLALHEHELFAAASGMDAPAETFRSRKLPQEENVMWFWT
jgi:hypothetical protein